MAKIKGTNKKNKLNGTNGNDKILGLGGDDTLKGKGGNDTLTGGTGNDKLDGGKGNDTAVYTGAWKDYSITQSGTTFTVTDTRGGSPDGTDTVTAVELFKFANGTFTAAQIVNDAPIAAADNFKTNEDNKLLLTAAQLFANDTDADSPLGDTLTLLSVQNAVNGTVSINAGNALFAPTPNFNGAASFTYTARDSAGATSTATVNVTVNAVNDAPVAFDDSAKGSEDTKINIANVLTNDVDVDGILNAKDIISVTTGKNGTVINNNDGTFIYTPNANFFGTDSFDYIISDGEFKDTGTVMVTVTGVDDGPTVISGLTVTESTIGFTATDPDGGSLTLVSPFATPFGNPAVPNGGVTTLSPAQQAAGVSGTLQVNDGVASADVVGLFLGSAGKDTENRIASGVKVALYGFGGDDFLHGGSADDKLYGGDNNDNLIGYFGFDTLSGGNGDDVLQPGHDAQFDFVDGGAGTGDWVSYEEAGNAFGIIADLSNALVGAEDFITNVENIRGTNQGDTLSGDNLDNRIEGLNGLDTMFGLDGTDTFVLVFDGVVDVIDGGNQIDWATYENEKGGVFAALGGTSVGGNSDILANVDYLRGSLGNDFLLGDAQANRIEGWGGSDVLTGAGGGDDLVGGSGGNNTASYNATDLGAANGTGVIASLANSAVNTNDAAGDTYTNIQNLEGTNAVP
ncbi:MAG: tandem-95 repeat protein, partial [Hyphomicrobium sp.]